MGSLPLVVAVLLAIGCLLTVIIYAWFAFLLARVVVRYAAVFIAGGVRAVRDYRRRKKSSTSSRSRAR